MQRWPTMYSTEYMDDSTRAELGPIRGSRRAPLASCQKTLPACHPQNYHEFVWRPLWPPIHTTCFQGNCGEWDFECESRDRNSRARQTGHLLRVRPAINRRAHLTEYKVKIVWVTKGGTGKEAIAESGQRTAFSRNRSGERVCRNSNPTLRDTLINEGNDELNRALSVCLELL
jgi:hypothetical protein